uniref:protein-tyrosine-phosphatase n=1 Tax=Glossina brevipalpis TaxID=37001 RepID=A0A1A9W0Q5_9MUSC
MSSQKWFHPRISAVEAEKLLLEKGFNGSFLVHLSASDPDAFTLLIRRDQEVIKFIIQNNNYFFHLCDTEKFATLTELIQFYMKNGGLKTNNGDLLELGQPLMHIEPINEKWYHANIPVKECEKLLLNRGKTGSFLVRQSQSKSGDYTLSVRINDDVRHFTIHWQNNNYGLGKGEPFVDTLSALIEHYKRHPLVEICGTAIHLTQPLNVASIAISNIDGRVKQLHNKDGFSEEFAALNRASRDQFPHKEGNKLENRNKNRYSDILPYDYTRVKLIDVDHGVDGADYINANYICFPIDGERVIDVNALQGNFCTSKPNSSNTNTLVQVKKNSSNSQLIRRGFKNTKHSTKIASMPINNSVSSSNKSDNLCKPKQSEFFLKGSSINSSCTLCSPNNNSPSDVVNGNKSIVVTSDGGKLSNNLTKPEELKTYIATQGCLTNTIVDFWNMIWQENTRVIIMITEEFERGKSKCARYWTNKGETKQFGPAKIKCISKVTSLEKYILREFLFSWRDQSERHIYHYHFQAWPDHKVPSSSDSVLDFLKDVNTKQKQLIQTGRKPGPICVHCSAGIGRTGTFIVIDIILDQIDKNGIHTEIDIQRTIGMVRSQRLGLVQTVAQYKFIYYAVQRYIQRTSKRC